MGFYFDNLKIVATFAENKRNDERDSDRTFMEGETER